MDIVYILGTSSQWENNEIRYSLRSVQKHLKGIDQVFIVGHDPGIFKDIFHIDVPDRHPKNKARNIYEKILAACRDERVSDRFICFPDDIFLLQDFEADNFPYYYCGDLKETAARLGRNSKYAVYVQNTIDLLEKNNLPTINFNGHTPIVYDKRLYIDTMTRHDWEIRKGYISKSLYCNSLNIQGEYLKDKKFHFPFSKTAIYRKIKGFPMFSAENEAMENNFAGNIKIEGMKEILQELYPDKTMIEV